MSQSSTPKGWLRVVGTLAMLSIMFGGFFSPANVMAGSDGNNGKVCVGNHQPGGPPTMNVVAPEGFLISEVCVKAGSANQGDGPYVTTFDPPVESTTLSHPSGKDISHWTWVLVPKPAPPPFEANLCVDGVLTNFVDESAYNAALTAGATLPVDGKCAPVVPPFDANLCVEGVLTSFTDEDSYNAALAAGATLPVDGKCETVVPEFEIEILSLGYNCDDRTGSLSYAANQPFYLVVTVDFGGEAKGVLFNGSMVDAVGTVELVHGGSDLLKPQRIMVIAGLTAESAIFVGDYSPNCPDDPVPNEPVLVIHNVKLVCGEVTFSVEDVEAIGPESKAFVTLHNGASQFEGPIEVPLIAGQAHYVVAVSEIWPDDNHMRAEVTWGPETVAYGVIDPGSCEAVDPEPETPEEPEVPTEPETPEEPEVPEEPEAPTEPKEPTEPETPEVPETPTTPEQPGQPEAPVTPAPSAPEKPTTPDSSSDEDVTGLPKAGVGDGTGSQSGVLLLIGLAGLAAALLWKISLSGAFGRR